MQPPYLDGNLRNLFDQEMAQRETNVAPPKKEI